MTICIVLISFPLIPFIHTTRVDGVVFAHFESFVCGGGAAGNGVWAEGGAVCGRGGGDGVEVVSACVWWRWA